MKLDGLGIRPDVGGGAFAGIQVGVFASYAGRNDPVTNAEVNEKVARKLGHKLVHISPGLIDRPFEGITKSDGMTEVLPNYSGDIAAAWEILEKYGFVLSRHPGGYSCELITNGSSASSTLRYHESAHTAPMAICLAFLKL